MGVVAMYRLASVITLALVLLLSVSLLQGKEVTPALKMEKDCVVFGRIDGHTVEMEFEGSDLISNPWFPERMEMKGFAIVNPYSGMKYQLVLSDEGYFCLNLDPGSYELGTRDVNGSWIIIGSFEVPYGRMVNLGTYRVEMKSSTHPADWVWHNCSIGPFTRTVRFNHLGDTGSYNRCEEWFASCHEAVYGHFASLPLRD
jgi:hypothetical protein